MRTFVCQANDFKKRVRFTMFIGQMCENSVVSMGLLRPLPDENKANYGLRIVHARLCVLHR